jgi:hypothetical protein
MTRVLLERIRCPDERLHPDQDAVRHVADELPLTTPRRVLRAAPHDYPGQECNGGAAITQIMQRNSQAAGPATAEPNVLLPLSPGGLAGFILTGYRVSTLTVGGARKARGEEQLHD